MSIELSALEEMINNWAHTINKRYKIPDSFRIMLKETKSRELKPRSYGYVVVEKSTHGWMKDENNALVRPNKVRIVNSARDLLDQSNVTLVEVYSGDIVRIVLYVPLIKNKEGDNLQIQISRTVKRMKQTIERTFKYLSNPRLHRDNELFNPTVVGDTVHEYYYSSDPKIRAWRKRKNNPEIVNDHHKSEFSILVKREVTFIHKETGISHTVEDFNNSRTEWEMRQQCWEECADLVDSYYEIESEKSRELVPMSLYEDAQLPNKILQDIYLG